MLMRNPLTGIMHMERTALTLRVNAWIGRGLCAAHGAAPERGYAALKAAFRGVSPSTSPLGP